MKVSTSTVNKVVVTITVGEMWRNAVTRWANYAYETEGKKAEVLDMITDLVEGLLTDDMTFDADPIRALFRDGFAPMLLPEEAMAQFHPSGTVREVIVTDDEEPTCSITVYHQDIVF